MHARAQARWLIRDASGEHSWQVDDTEAKMRQLLFACALFLTACAPAHADPIQANPELLNACIAAAGEDRAALEACRGSVARPCIELEGQGYHSDVLCWSEEISAWRELINVATTRIESNDADEGARLRPANAAWESWLDAECYYRAYEFGGGVGENVDRINCAADLTSARAIELLTEH
jgi:uncharacterized protein YecT (DUF1311 family)